MKMNKNNHLKFILMSLIVLVLLCLSTVSYIVWDNAHIPEYSKILDKLSQLDKARLLEAEQLRRAIGDEVLPGWDQAEIPVILYNEEYAFLTGISVFPPDGWKTIRSNQQRGTAWEIVPDDDFQGQPYYRQVLSPGITPQAFTVKVGETFAGSMTTLEYYPIMMHMQLQDGLPDFVEPLFPFRFYINALLGSSDQYISAILHEEAHAYQGLSALNRLVAGEQASFDFEKLYPWEDTKLRGNWESELAVLAQALRAKSNEEAQLLVQEFLQIRNDRRNSARLSVELIEFERQREWVEGIARYAEISVYRLAHERVGYSPVLEILDDPDFHYYENFDQRWQREIDQMKRMAKDKSEGRFYYTGMAQAVLLDRLVPGWKSHLFDPDIWLEDLLKQALSSAKK